MKKKTYQCPLIVAVVPIPDAMMVDLPLDASNSVTEGDAKQHGSWFWDEYEDEQPEVEHKSLWD